VYCCENLNVLFPERVGRLCIGILYAYKKTLHIRCFIYKILKHALLVLSVQIRTGSFPTL
jgi:hypothetical protein